jgi:hypothetical protein
MVCKKIWFACQQGVVPKLLHGKYELATLPLHCSTISMPRNLLNNFAKRLSDSAKFFNVISLKIERCLFNQRQSLKLPLKG